MTLNAASVRSFLGRRIVRTDCLTTTRRNFSNIFFHRFWLPNPSEINQTYILLLGPINHNIFYDLGHCIFRHNTASTHKKVCTRATVTVAKGSCARAIVARTSALCKKPPLLYNEFCLVLHHAFRTSGVSAASMFTF